MYKPPKVHLIIKLTEKCNYACSFCRYAGNHSTDNGIAADTVRKIMTECVQYNIANNQRNLNIIWHGGEPLLYTQDRFEELMQIEADLTRKYGVVFNNSMQTNGSLLNDSWCDFLKKYNFQIGISYDGPGDLNGHTPTADHNGQEIFLKTISLLRQKGMGVGILSVITDAHCGREAEFLDFFRNAGIKSLGLCACYDQSGCTGVDPVKMAGFLCRLFDYNRETGWNIRIRELSNAVSRSVGDCTSLCKGNNRKYCGSYLTITPSGDVTFCDDLDLDMKHRVGNVKVQTLGELIESDFYQKFHAESMQFMEKNCRKCEIYNLCNAGCPRYDIDGSNNYFCETNKRFLPYVAEQIDEELQKKDFFSVMRIKKMRS